MWSKEATISEAKRQAVLRDRRCVVHLEVPQRIRLIADAMKSAGHEPSPSPFTHDREPTCRFEKPADQARRRARVVALLEEARLKMEDDKRALETCSDGR